MTWGGAQWLVVFFIALRVLIGAAKVNGTITIVPQTLTPKQEYIRGRVSDALLLVILWWGGFFS